MRASTSANHANGSISLSFAEAISVVMAAARAAPRSEPAKSHDFLPRAKPRSARSAALLVHGTATFPAGAGAKRKRPAPTTTRPAMAAKLLKFDGNTNLRLCYRWRGPHFG